MEWFTQGCHGILSALGLGCLWLLGEKRLELSLALVGITAAKSGRDKSMYNPFKITK